MLENEHYTYTYDRLRDTITSRDSNRDIVLPAPGKDER